MAAAGIRVTPEQLQQISAQLDAGASSIEGTLRQLSGNVAPLGSDWAGVAQARFLELWAEWQRSGAALHQALTGIAPPHRPRRRQLRVGRARHRRQLRPDLTGTTARLVTL
jgi:WXG100 family type VII secretion target